MAYFFPTSFNTVTGLLQSAFNVADFQVSDGFITAGQLMSYANLYNVNTFTNTNYFTNIFVGTIDVENINSISSNTLNFIANVTSDIQQQFTNLLPNAGILVDLTNNEIELINPTYLFSISTPNNVAISGDCAVSGILNIPQINNVSLNTQTINCNSIVANSIICRSDVGCYINYSGITIPIMKSQNSTNTIFTTAAPIIFMVTIKPNYYITFLDSNEIILGSVNNTTTDFIYNYPISLSVIPSSIKIFFNYIQL